MNACAALESYDFHNILTLGAGLLEDITVSGSNKSSNARVQEGSCFTNL